MVLEKCKCGWLKTANKKPAYIIALNLKTGSLSRFFLLVIKKRRILPFFCNKSPKSPSLFIKHIKTLGKGNIMKSQISALIQLTCIFIITLCFSTELFAQENPYDSSVGSFMEALEYAKKPAENMRFEFTREIFTDTLTTGESQQTQPGARTVQDYTITISGNLSKIEKETKKYESEIDSEPYDITQSIEIYDNTLYRRFSYKPNLIDIPKTGFINPVPENYTDMSYRIYGWPGDITKTFLKEPSIFHFVESEVPDIYIIEFMDTGIQRIYIDSQKNFNIVRWQMLKSDETVLYEFIYQLKQTKDEIWYPYEYQRIYYPTLSDGIQSESKIAEITRITKVECNIDIPEETFNLEFPAGTKVRDSVNRSIYIVSDSNSPVIE